MFILLSLGALGLVWWFRLIPDLFVYGLLLVPVAMAFTKAQRAMVFKREDGECEKCGKDWKQGYYLEVHHILPESDGGGDTLDNAQLLCILDHAQAHEDLAYEANKRGDKKSARNNAWATRQIKKKSIWRRGHEPKDEYKQGKLF